MWALKASSARVSLQVGDGAAALRGMNYMSPQTSRQAVVAAALPGFGGWWRSTGLHVLSIQLAHSFGKLK